MACKQVSVRKSKRFIQLFTIRQDPQEGGEKQTFDGLQDNRSGIFLGLLG